MTYNRNDNDKNFAYCNICNQRLLCNHFRLGISYLQEDNPINYDQIMTSLCFLNLRYKKFTQFRALLGFSSVLGGCLGKKPTVLNLDTRLTS